MKVVITLDDTEDGLVQVEELRQPGLGESEQLVTVATALADEMLSLLDRLGCIE